MLENSIYKQEMKKILIKDIIIAVVAYIIGAIVFTYAADGFIVAGLVCGFVAAGIPFGWKWLNNIFISFSLYTVAIKAILSLFVGIVALPVIIIKDIINYKTAE